jgi:hypothetical protein
MSGRPKSTTRVMSFGQSSGELFKVGLDNPTVPPCWQGKFPGQSVALFWLVPDPQTLFPWGVIPSWAFPAFVGVSGSRS